MIKNIVDIDKKQIVLDGCMVTVSGTVIDLYNPDANLITIEDIAHGLAYNCRWNGHTQGFWSVAQHCCMMFDQAPEGERLKYLLHDAEEAYWGDMIKPLKNKIKTACPEIIELMRLMRRIIFDKFGVAYPDKGVEDKDFELLQWEFENIIKTKSAIFWPPDFAKQEFLERFYAASYLSKTGRPDTATSSSDPDAWKRESEEQGWENH